MTGGGRGRGGDSLKAENTRGWRSHTNTKHSVLTAPELGGVVKVGEERVKLIRTEERVPADLRAAGSSYRREDGGVEGKG